MTDKDSRDEYESSQNEQLSSIKESIDETAKGLNINKYHILAFASILLSVLKVPLVPLILAILAYRGNGGIITIIALVLSVGVLLYVLQLAMFTDTSFFDILFDRW